MRQTGKNESGQHEDLDVCGQRKQLTEESQKGLSVADCGSKDLSELFSPDLEI
jgi:hypothetical protein